MYFFKFSVSESISDNEFDLILSCAKQIFCNCFLNIRIQIVRDFSGHL